MAQPEIADSAEGQREIVESAHALIVSRRLAADAEIDFLRVIVPVCADEGPLLSVDGEIEGHGRGIWWYLVPKGRTVVDGVVVVDLTISKRQVAMDDFERELALFNDELYSAFRWTVTSYAINQILKNE